MTVRKPMNLLFRARGSDWSFRFTVSITRRSDAEVLSPRAHEVVGDDPETDPSTDAVGPAVATAPETMSTFEHTDSAVRETRKRGGGPSRFRLACGTRSGRLIVVCAVVADSAL